MAEQKYGDLHVGRLSDTKEVIHIKDYLREQHRGQVECQCCSGILVGKQGSQLAHHFAPKSGKVCDHWLYGDAKGQWHIRWQNLCHVHCIEHVVIREAVKHIADIYSQEQEKVIEVQHSYISQQQIAEREAFYGNLVWVFDATGRDIIDARISLTGIGLIFLQRPYFKYAKKQSYLDTTFGLFEVLHYFTQGRVFVVKLTSLDNFVETHIADIKVPQPKPPTKYVECIRTNCRMYANSDRAWWSGFDDDFKDFAKAHGFMYVPHHKRWECAFDIETWKAEKDDLRDCAHDDINAKEEQPKQADALESQIQMCISLERRIEIALERRREIVLESQRRKEIALESQRQMDVALESQTVMETAEKARRVKERLEMTQMSIFRYFKRV